MIFKIQMQEALTNIFAARLRSILAVLGILVGTASVVAMVSGGELATRQALQEFKNLGTNLLAISINDNADSTANQNKLALNTALDLKNASNDIEIVAPYTNIYTQVNFKGKEISAGIIGATDNLSHVMKFQLLKGRFVSYYDRYMPFCVIGNSIYNEIKSSEPNPIGKQIQLGKDIFTIIGILQKSSANSSFIYANIDHTVFIPIKSSLLLSRYADIDNIVMRVNPDVDNKKLEKQIQNYFQSNVTGKHLYFRSAEEIISSMKKQKQILTIFLGFIGSIALIVGGIGVMNIMLVSVNERRREIGIRLAVGAKRRDIQSLFLVESVLLSLIGGVLGVLIGIILSYIIAVSKHWGFVLFFDPPIVGFCVSVFIGIFFGFYPAHKASKLDPIQTLRAE